MNRHARTWLTLSGFKRDVVIAVLRRGGQPDAEPDERPHGLAIKRELSIVRDEKIHHGRLYPNLDALVNTGVLAKGKRDNRTNTYRVTDAGTEALAQYLTEYVGLPTEPHSVGMLPGQAFDEQTSKERGSEDDADDMA